MDIRLPKDQGRSLLDQLQSDYRDRFAQGKKNHILPQTPANIKDIFENSGRKTGQNSDKSPVKDGETPSAIQAGGLNISFQFDLFYELSSKVEAKMGQSGANRFAELSGKVSETFMGSFNLSIDAVGSFMNGTDKSLDISPETTGEFFDAVEGLADLSPEALEGFLKESDEFFAELENTYGKADGAFEDIKGMMQEQAKAFFADVEQVRSDALAGPQDQQTLPATEETAALPTSGVPAGTVETPADPGNSLIEMLFKPELQMSQDDYKAFLADFAEYAQKFRQQMFEKLLGSRSGYDQSGKAADDSEETRKNLIDTAI